MAEDLGNGGADHRERRRRQRFVAKRWGSVCFWIVIDGQRLPLNDLSLEGFSLPAGVPPLGSGAFPFVLQIDGVPDEVRGLAEGMNFVLGAEGGLFGCRFLSFEGEGAARLHDWLTVHVIATATIRISEKEAAAIVTGPSLI
ncbi:PilZ domain-containing protein [Zoogloea sp.]|uniref:PilZ domain-containing protein n=1 Tax=Zoogloea sp. TaxID=49181 RepID=UPI001AC5CAE1|nr:PilZ domain-containing protein [Zoogloea sp.]MBN8283338.1 PilZ domain-containing protein [Zoogloea sp.]